MLTRSLRLGGGDLGSRLLVGLVVVAGGLAVGGTVSLRPKYVLVGAVVAAAALVSARAPSNLGVLAVPGCLLAQRLPIGSSITISDAVLAAASVAAIPAVARLDLPASVRGVRRWLALYMAALTIVLAVNPSGHAGLEWAHRLVLVGGALVVGVWLAAEDRVRLALRLLLAGSLVLALAGIEYTLSHGLEPAYPLGYNKNFLGPVLVMTLLVLLIAPRSFDLPLSVRLVSVALLVGGGVSSQSRGALLGGAAGALTVAFVRLLSGERTALGAGRQRAGIVLLVAVTAGFGFFVYQSVSRELRASGGYGGTQTINSLTLRYGVETEAHRLFRAEPVTGNGIRYFQDPKIQALGPNIVAANNVIDEALAEGGLVDAIAFGAFILGSIVVVARGQRHPLALAGLALIVDRLVRGQVDIYWLAGDAALPWLVTGMGLYLGRTASGSAPTSASSVALPVPAGR